jgi:hypothetical protein
MNKLRIVLPLLLSLTVTAAPAENNAPAQVRQTTQVAAKTPKKTPRAAITTLDPAAAAKAAEEINNYNPDAHCRLCKVMQDARAAIDPNKKSDAQPDVVSAGHEAMLKAMNGFDSVKDAQSPEAMQEYMQQLIVLFERLDRVDPSTTAVERISAFMDDSDTKKPLMSALKTVPEALRKRVLERIQNFNKSQQENIANPASLQPASPGAGNQ